MQVDLVVFDLAGTTVRDDDAVGRCLRDALAGAGVQTDAQSINAVMGLPKRDALRRLIEDSPMHATRLPLLEVIHLDFVARMTAFYKADPSVCEVAGTSVVFTCLKRAGIKVAVNSGFSREIMQIVLDRLGWTRQELVDATVASDEVPRGRPYPDMIQHLITHLGIASAAHVAKVGDTPADLLEGTNAGCGLVIGVTGGTHRREELEQLPHTHLIASVAELPPLLGLDS